MSFQPVISGSGFAGWRMLQATMDRQRAAFAARPDQQRAEAAFRDSLPNFKNPADLVADRQALAVALGAHDLSADLNNRAFLRRVLEDGTSQASALANRLQDSRYKALARDFGADRFALGLANTSFQAEKTLASYRAVAFEAAVGERDGDLRLALSVQRLLPQLTEASGTENAAWYRLLGQPALREVFETAFGLPASFGKIDIDQQLSVMKQKSRAVFGTDSLSGLATDDGQEKLVQRFLLQAQVASIQTGTGLQTALALVSQTAAQMRARA